MAQGIARSNERQDTVLETEEDGSRVVRWKRVPSNKLRARALRSR